MSKEKKDEIRSEFPGREPKTIIFEDGSKAEVFPLGIKETVSSSREFAALLAVAREAAKRQNSANDQEILEIMVDAGPHVLTCISRLIGRCVRFRDTEGVPDKTRKFDDMPIMDCVPVIEAWWEASFSGKRERFFKQIDSLAARVVGRPVSISGMVSKFFSRLDTQEQTS